MRLIIIVVAFVTCVMYETAFLLRFHPVPTESNVSANEPRKFNKNEKYLFYYAHAGFANQLIALQKATWIAHTSKRTVIVPPVLPHIRSKTMFNFSGRGYKSIQDANIIAKEDAKMAMSLHNRTKFPSWSEILNYDKITEVTGVAMIDLYDFMKGGESAVSALLNHTVDIDSFPTDNPNWMDFMDFFESHYGDKTVALIGSAFVVQGAEDSQSFRMYDEDAAESIQKATLCFTPSDKLLGLLRSFHVHIPENYVGVHIRFGDIYTLSSCQESRAAEGFNDILSRLRGANVTGGSPLFLASKDLNAKKCFNEYSDNAYEVVTLDDIFTASSAKYSGYDAMMPRHSDAMSEVNLDLGTKYLLLDMLLVALGFNIFLVRVAFRPLQSTFQMLIEQRHHYRDELLAMINLSTDPQEKYE